MRFFNLLSCFNSVFLLNAFTFTSKDERRNNHPDLFHLDGENWKYTCFSNVTKAKLSRRLELKKECKQENESNTPTEWVKLQRKICDSNASMTEFTTESKKILTTELRQGAFLVDLAGKFPYIHCFIFSEFLSNATKMPPKHNYSSSTDITTSTTISAFPTLMSPRPLKMKQLVANGTTIAILAKVNVGAKSFAIRLLHDAPEFHRSIGATLLEINVNFMDERISWQAFNKREAYGKKTVPNHFPFVPGQEFKCLMTIMQNDTEIENVANVEKRVQIEVRVNGQKLFDDFIGNLPIWALNWMQIEGDIRLFESPAITFAKDSSGLFKHELQHLLYRGDILCIGGNFTETFKIYLLLGTNEYISNKIVENTAMRLVHINYDREDIEPMSLFEMQGFTFVENKMEWKNMGQQLYIDPLMETGTKITIKIEVISKFGKDTEERDREMVLDERFYLYKVSLVGNERIIYASNDYIPQWAANWVTVEHLDNPVLNPSNVEECKGAGQKELPGNIYKLDSNHLFVSGDLIEITVAGKVENETLVEVFLFHEALKFHKDIGQTVLRVRFMSGNFSFNSYSSKNYNPDPKPNEKWHYEADNATNSGILPEPLVANRTFELKIVAVKKDAFEISYGGVELHYIKSTLPIWAAQYVVVNGLKIPADGEPNLVKVEYKPQNKEAT